MAATSSELTPASVFAILLSLALVGGATLYYIKKKEAGEPLLPPPPQRPALPPQAPAAQAHAPPRRMPTAPPPRRMPAATSDHEVAPPPPPHAMWQPPAPPPVTYHRAPSPEEDVMHALAQAAAMFRQAWQRGVDDVTVLQTAAANPSLSDAQREVARQALAAAHIAVHAPPQARRPRRYAAQPTHAPLQQPYAQPYPQYMQPHAPPPPPLLDVSHAAPLEDLAHAAQQFGTHLGDWARDVEHWMPHGAPIPHAPPAQPPVTYTPYPMPTTVPAHEAAHDIAPPIAHGPTFWATTAQHLGLVKPGDRLINVGEAQHYLNVLGTGVQLAEDSIFGDETHAAIKGFQLKHHLPMSGEIDPETSAALIYAAFTAATPQFIEPGF